MTPKGTPNGKYYDYEVRHGVKLDPTWSQFNPDQEGFNQKRKRQIAEGKQHGTIRSN